MNENDYFPRGIAFGKAFCNRSEERCRIKENIKSGVHTLVEASRRYGKTSLITQTINESATIYGAADLFVAINSVQVENEILKAIKSIIKQVCTPVEQGLQIIREYLVGKTSQWTIGTRGVDIAITSDKASDPIVNILDALSALEVLLAKKRQRAVMFIDEMQEIGELPEGKGIEGAVRHVAQQTKFLVFIFSGSNRHLLARMFGDHSRPLYKLCDRMQLSRISEEHYKFHLNKLATKCWGKKLSQEAFGAIGYYTEWHTYYVNILCAELWKRGQLPTKESIKDMWLQLSRVERLETINALTKLSVGQQKILIRIANGYGIKLTGKGFLQKVNLSSSSVIESVGVLEFHDYIEKDSNGSYRLIDPMMKTAINVHYDDYEL